MPFVLATILFVARMAAKTWGLGGGWGGDDYSLIVAYICTLSCMCAITMVYTDCIGVVGWWFLGVFDEYALFSSFLR